MLFDSPATIQLLRIHFLIFFIFTTLYYSVGFERHFVCDRDTASPFSPIYFSAVVHTSLGFGDCGPKTPLGRRLVTVHTLCSFVSTLLVIATWRSHHQPLSS